MVLQIKHEPLDLKVEDTDQLLEPKQEIIIDNDKQSDEHDLVDIKIEPLDLESDRPNPLLKSHEITVNDKDCRSDVVVLDNSNQEPPTNHQKSALQKSKSKTKEQIQETEKALNDFFRMVCELCGYEAPSFKLLLCHFKKIHCQPGYVVCCGEKLYLEFTLKLHMQNHMNPDGELCEICNKRFRKISIHRRMVHSKEGKKILCDKCPKAFVNMYSLDNHMKKHQPKTHQNIPCPQCDMKLASKNSLRAHIFHMHCVERPRMICDFCGKQFLNKPCFDRHVNKHKGIEPQIAYRKIQCHICKKMLHAEPALKRHLKLVHAETTETHECDECHQKYPNSVALQSHKARVHIKAKFKCEFCEKLFKNNFKLQEHRATHFGERLWKCEYCETALKTKSSLWSHVKKQHPAEHAEQKRLAAEKACS
ncbi:zinc finger protein 62-like isoform X2 [Uranotaenia lowii]|nr:zinc finger protein 62-like isoform X2 [Uranotaenia lowii]